MSPISGGRPKGREWFRPALAILLAALVVVAAALLWYPPLYQSSYAPASAEAFFDEAEPGRVNLNTAGLPELTALPGIGEAKAEAILAYRAENGPFESVEALEGVNGIGPKIIDGLRDYVTIGD